MARVKPRKTPKKPTAADKRPASERRISDYTDSVKDAIDAHGLLTPREATQALKEIVEYIETVSLSDVENRR